MLISQSRRRFLTIAGASAFGLGGLVSPMWGARQTQQPATRRQK